MTVLYRGDKSFILTTPATLVNEDRELASTWATSHIQQNEALKWILANYVEADRPNRNNQMWSFDDLQMSKPTILHSPMNMLHHQEYIVGTWTAAEMIFPTGVDEEVAEVMNPYIETLGAFWSYYFPDELQAVESAYAQGKLAVSMECVGKSLTCAGDDGCGEEFAFMGPSHESYCEHLRNNASTKQINQPHFLGGALILPPARPGWADAHVREISKKILDTVDDESLSKLYNDIKASMEELSSEEIEHQMTEIVSQDKKSAKRLADDFLAKWKNGKKVRRRVNK